MREFCRKDHLPTLIVNQSDPCYFAAWIEFQV
jgi:hypothetical protein